MLYTGFAVRKLIKLEPETERNRNRISGESNLHGLPALIKLAGRFGTLDRRMMRFNSASCVFWGVVDRFVSNIYSQLNRSETSKPDNFVSFSTV